MTIDVIIPAYNEESSIALVLRDIPRSLVREIVVVDNRSTDQTAARSREQGATVLREEERGYGAACLKGIAYLAAKTDSPDIVVFLDADYSDHPTELDQLIQPILNGDAKMVIGSRVKKFRERGSMTPQQVFGNWLATFLMRKIYRVKYTDLGPFRAIDFNTLMQIGMVDRNYGWTVEMQIKVAKQKIPFQEVEVHYRKRIGVSKVSGTVKGTIMAGYKIIKTILKYR